MIYDIFTYLGSFLMTNSTKSSLTYRDAGVDIDAGDALVDRIKPLAAKTMREGVMAGIGGFWGLFGVTKKKQETGFFFGTDGGGAQIGFAV